MEIFQEGIKLLQMFVTAIGGGFVIFGLVHLAEGNGNDNAAAKSTGVKLFVAGAFIVIVGLQLVPMLSTAFNV